MRNKLPRMRLSHEEEIFLRHWIYDELHYPKGQCSAKRLQVEHGVVPADMATIVAASMPEPEEQEAAGLGPPPAEPPLWPWSDDTWRDRRGEARLFLAQRRRDRS